MSPKSARSRSKSSQFRQGADHFTSVFTSDLYDDVSEVEAVEHLFDLLTYWSMAPSEWQMGFLAGAQDLIAKRRAER